MLKQARPEPGRRVQHDGILDGLTIRPATADDIPAILALLDDDELSRGREDPSLPLDPRYAEAFEALAADPNQLLVLAELDGRPAGTMQLSFIPGLNFRGAWRGQIEAVRVASDLRGRRIGEAMAAWAIERCRERGCRFVQLFTMKGRADAHRFYERLGFTPSHLGFKLQLEGDAP